MVDELPPLGACSPFVLFLKKKIIRKLVEVEARKSVARKSVARRRRAGKIVGERDGVKRFVDVAILHGKC
jgi:hypothetical protein